MRQMIRFSLFLILWGYQIPSSLAFRAHRPSALVVTRNNNNYHFRGGAQVSNVPRSSQKMDSHNPQTIASTTTTTTTTTKTTLTKTSSSVPVQKSTRTLWAMGSLIVISMLLFQQRAFWLPLVNKDLILQRTLELLEPLQSNRLGWLYYSVGLALWEFCGLSTIPVETAAGMVLGWKAVGASLLGKFTGAMIAFGIGRCWLYQHIATQLQHNELFQLINQASSSATATATTGTLHPHSPLLTAFLMKFSCFPEMVKNFGSSLLPVIQLWMFATATLLHGGIFTVLWTWLGQQSTAGAAATGSSTTIALSIAAFMGLVVTPIVMGWWIRDLKRWAEINHTSSEKGGTKI